MLLLMDEPTSALDPARRGALGETLRELAAQGRALLISTHDVDFVEDFADRVAVLADGVLVEQGPTREILASPGHAATRALLRGEPSPVDAGVQVPQDGGATVPQAVQPEPPRKPEEGV
jgi:microcin C transport system ATP-binding protein